MKDFRMWNDRIRNPPNKKPLREEDQSLENLRFESVHIADELLSILSTVRVDEEATKLKSFQKALKTIWQKSKIEETAQRLKSIREALQFHVTCSTESKIDMMLVKNEQDHEIFNQASQTIASAMPELKDTITRFMGDQVQFLAVQHSEYEAAAIQRHEEILRKLGDAPASFTSLAQLVQRPDPNTVLRTVIDRLYFRQFRDQLDDIEEAHKKTFEWILDPGANRDTPSFVNFHDCFHSSSGVYWVSGKAGSGKSTLMKYLMSGCEEPLRTWAGETPLLLLSFFSWHAGSALQKSHQGLLRSLLHFALNRCPELGPKFFPDQYGATTKWQDFPSLHQLRRAFKELLNQTSIPLKIAILIDGLDDFDASDSEMKKLIDILRLGARSSHAKAILSSRPLALYEHAFEDDPKLRLHHLTHADIATYVSDTLVSHKRMVRIRNADPEGAERLTSSLIDSASGVFMWVRLAVNNLLEGLQNYDTMPELQKRLDMLPCDLEWLFAHMLESIPSEYRKESSRIFQVIRHGGSDLTACELYFSDFSYAEVQKAEISPLSGLEVQDIQSHVEGRLRSRCFVLAELRSRSLGIEHDSGVSYLHKTVADFLYRKDIWEQIVEKSKDTKFSPDSSMLKATIMTAKVLPPGFAFARPGYRSLLESVAKYAKAEELRTGSANEVLLDELDRTMALQAKKLGKAYCDSLNDWCNSVPSSTFGGKPIPKPPNFLSWSILSGLEIYAIAKIRECGQLLSGPMGDCLLMCCGYYSWLIPAGAHPPVVQVLLENGANPDEGWEKRLEYTMDIHQNLTHLPVVTPYSYPVPPDDALQWISILTLLVCHRADPNTVLGSEEMENTGIRAEVDALTRLLREKGAIVIHEEKKGDEWVPVQCSHRVDTEAIKPDAQNPTAITMKEVQMPSLGSLKSETKGRSKRQRFLRKLTKATSG